MLHGICHKMPFYDILWQMPRDIKCHKVCQYGYQKNRLDQTNWSTGFKIIFQENNQTKNAKNWNSHFSLVFLRRFLYNFQWICGGVKQPQNPKIFFPLAHICHGAQNTNGAKRLDTFYYFHTALLVTPRSHENFSAFTHIKDIGIF